MFVCYVCFSQGGFRKGLGCLMSSLSLQECISYANENRSKLYACFLDSRQAFDRVWHQGLIYKLMEAGVDHITLKCFVELYNNCTSKVRYKSRTSSMFPVLQGTRQGGISSPALYLIYINDLISELEQSGAGICLGGYSISSLSVADDMVLLSFSRKGLHTLMDICYRYSCKWRYLYNPTKCSVVVFNETKHHHKTY